MNSPDRNIDEMPDWKFPDLISHLLASHVMANGMLIQMFNESGATLSDLAFLPAVRPTIPTLQPTFTPTREQWTIIDRVDAGVEEINTLINHLRSGSEQGVQREDLDRLNTLLETLLHF